MKAVQSCFLERCALKCLYYGLWKVNILVLGSPTTGWHACKVKKHFHFLIICIYFYLICSTTPKRLIFPNPSSVWRYSALIGRFHLKQCLWAQCYFVYSVTVETAIFNATKVTPSGNKWAGNMLMIDVDVKQGLVLKTTRFNDSESTLSFERR